MQDRLRPLTRSEMKKTNYLLNQTDGCGNFAPEIIGTDKPTYAPSCQCLKSGLCVVFAGTENCPGGLDVNEINNLRCLLVLSGVSID